MLLPGAGSATLRGEHRAYMRCSLYIRLLRLLPLALLNGAHLGVLFLRAPSSSGAGSAVPRGEHRERRAQQRCRQEVRPGGVVPRQQDLPRAGLLLKLHRLPGAMHITAAGVSP